VHPLHVVVEWFRDRRVLVTGAAMLGEDVRGDGELTTAIDAPG